MRMYYIILAVIISFLSISFKTELTSDYQATKGQYEDHQYKYVYGTIDPHYQWVDRDAFLQVVTKDNQQVVHTLTIKEEGIQEPVFFGRLSENRFLFVVEHFYYFESFSIQQYRYTEWIVVDPWGMYVNSVHWTEQALDYVNILDILVVQTRNQRIRIKENLTTEVLTSLSFEVYGDQVLTCVMSCQDTNQANSLLEEAGVYHVDVLSPNGYRYPFQIIVHPKEVLLYQNYRSTELIQWVSKGDVYLNHKPLSVGETISIPGNHTIQIYGKNQYHKIVQLTIIPSLHGLPSDRTAHGAVQLTTNAPILKVNGEIYPSGHTFYQSGFYQVLLEGVGNYQETHTFTILPFVFGLKDGDILSSPWTIYLNSEATLNGKPIVNGTLISEEGLYVLQLLYQGVVTETIQFEIQKNSTQPPQADRAFPFHTVGLAILALIGIYLIFKKK